MSDDITFCPHADCELKSCMRHQSNIRQPQYPHSFSVETPEDCIKQTPKPSDEFIDKWLAADSGYIISKAELEKAISIYEKTKEIKE